MSDALKHDLREKKVDMSLLPLDVLEEVAKPYVYGLVKYKRENWRKGTDTNRWIAAALRHICDFKDRGQIYDKEAFDISGERVMHLAMAVFNLLSAIDAILHHPEKVSMYIPRDWNPDVPLRGEDVQIIARLLTELGYDGEEFEKSIKETGKEDKEDLSQLR